jgi:hypothetical protein
MEILNLLTFFFFSFHHSSFETKETHELKTISSDPLPTPHNDVSSLQHINSLSSPHHESLTWTNMNSTIFNRFVNTFREMIHLSDVTRSSLSSTIVAATNSPQPPCPTQQKINLEVASSSTSKKTRKRKAGNMMTIAPE